MDQEYVKVKFKGGWALVHKKDPEIGKYERYTEPSPEPVQPEVKKNATDSRGRKRTK